MKKCVISYSMTGNNEALAKRVANAIDATNVIITEKKRSMGKVIFDLIFGRIPKVQPEVSIIDKYDEIILVGPVWMGKVATPLRSFLLHLKEKNQPYKFITISGGALNKNPDLKDDLIKFGGDNLLLLKDMYISDLLDKNDVTKKETSAYKLSKSDLDILEKAIVQSLA